MDNREEYNDFIEKSKCAVCEIFINSELDIPKEYEDCKDCELEDLKKTIKEEGFSVIGESKYPNETILYLKGD